MDMNDRTESLEGPEMLPEERSWLCRGDVWW